MQHRKFLDILEKYTVVENYSNSIVSFNSNEDDKLNVYWDIGYNQTVDIFIPMDTIAEERNDCIWFSITHPHPETTQQRIEFTAYKRVEFNDMVDI